MSVRQSLLGCKHLFRLNIGRCHEKECDPRETCCVGGAPNLVQVACELAPPACLVRKRDNAAAGESDWLSGYGQGHVNGPRPRSECPCVRQAAGNQPRCRRKSQATTLKHRV